MNGVIRSLRRPFVNKTWLAAEERLEQYGLSRKSHGLEVAKTLLLLLLCATVAWGVVEFFHLEKVTWDKALGFFLTVSGVTIAYRQWLANRYEISLDKYYDRLEVANRRLEILEGVTKEDMHSFVELDKLEYVIVKYGLGYIPPEMALRALTNFKGHCADRSGFRERTLGLAEKASYLDRTRRVVRAVCEECNRP